MRIILADDQPKVRFALRVLLERQQGLEVVAEAVDVQDLLGQVRETQPDLVLLGWELPGGAAGSLIGTLRETCPGLMVIVLSGRLQARREALAAGADAFVSKSEQPEHLLGAIGSCRPEMETGDAHPASPKNPESP